MPSASPFRRLTLDVGQRLIPYAEGDALQRTLHAEIAAGKAAPALVAMEMEPVYTVGRRTHSWERPQAEAIGESHVPVVDVDRGGKTTWHGPGQLTIYPILKLRKLDVIEYVRALESAVIELCARYGLQAMRVEGRSGVWLPATPQYGSSASTTPQSHPSVPATPTPSGSSTDATASGRVISTLGASSEPTALPDRKICALGVRVAQGTTLHGIGFNVNPDLEAFSLDRIIPCGISDAAVTSLATELGRDVSVTEVLPQLLDCLEDHLTPLADERAQPLGVGNPGENSPT